MNYFLALYATSATLSMLCGNITSVPAFSFLIHPAPHSSHSLSR